jgi:phosphoglycolate phosphatase-like HAD superfamily hydrolase
MRAVAFDFDGVLCDSSREVFVVAVDTYTSMAPTSHLASRLQPLRDDAVTGGEAFRGDTLYRRFLDLLPLGNRAEDFGVALRAIDGARSIADQNTYDGFFASIEPQWLQRFHHHFYEQRSALRRTDRDAWIGLHQPYPGLAEALRRGRGEHTLAVVTAKDRRSVELLLGALGLDGVLDRAGILDKETGIAKTEHLEVLRERTGIGFAHMTFIDDKLNHLRTVATLGVRPVLAGWGFNTEREHREADEAGFEIATLDTAATVLFREEIE